MEALLQQVESLNIAREWFLLGAVLLAVTLAVFTLGFVMFGVKSGVERRVEYLAEPEAKRQRSRVRDTLESLSPLYVPGNSKEKESIRHQLMHAGLHEKSALGNFYAIKIFSFVIGVVLAGSFYLTLGDFSQLNLIIALSVLGGLFLPNIVLDRMVKKRQRKIRAGVPDALDLLVVCTESGLGFMAAMKRVANETYIAHPEFADELETVCIKVKAGVELPQAFNELVIRTGLYELGGLVSMLSHASRIGGSLSGTLRDYTEDYRDKRNQAAEELAAKIPTKMMFPMVLFIWPCFFIVAVGPAILNIMKAFE
ncbi:type II secretion system F family protein [Vibrio maritimus]|jgi:tight adherence protein C